MVYPNYYETWSNLGGGSYPLYFIMDNTTGSPKVRHIFIIPNGFYDVHMPDYSYSVDHYSWIVKIENFDDYVRKLRRIYGDTISSRNYYVVQINLGEYDKRIEYLTYDLGAVEDIDTLLEPFVKNPAVVVFADMERMGIPLDYEETEIIHGSPIEKKRVKVTEGSRKSMMLTGWLFVDTMNLEQERVLEIVKWRVDDDILSVIYRVSPDGERTPVNGVRYPYAMEVHKLPVCYQ